MTKILPPTYLFAAIVLMIPVHLLMPLSVFVPFDGGSISLHPSTGVLHEY
jgi:hypothetical protein